MKRFVFFLILTITTAICSSALSLDDIKKSGNYYWGEGVHVEASHADKIAIEMLSSQISVSVSSNTSIVNASTKVRKQGKKQTDEKSEYKSVINTYTQATIDNSEVLSFQENDKTRIIRYIEKEHVYKVFQSRRRQISDLIEYAEKQLNIGKIDVALKNYYWAYSLLRSMPGTGTEEWRGNLLCNYLPQRIEDILDNISIKVLKRVGNDFDLLFTYQGKPISSLDYYVKEGGYFGPMYNAGEGHGEASLFAPEPADKIEIEIEFRYKEQAADAQMNAVLNGVSDYNTKYATRFVRTDEIVSPISSSETQLQHTESSQKSDSTINTLAFDLQSEITKNSTLNQGYEDNTKSESKNLPTELLNPSKYKSTVELLLNYIVSKKSTSSISHLFTDAGLQKYSKIIRAGNARLIDGNNLHFWLNSQDNVVCRGAVLSFKYRSGKYRTFTRDVVFTFNSDGLIDNIALGLGESPRNDILGETSIPEKIRHAIVEFIENYQTAFALKELGYIESIFHDNAIIITGTEIKQAGRVENYIYRNDKKIIYNRRSKKEYLSKLKNTFKSLEYVNLRFDNINVVRIDDTAEVYGIQLEQDYFSPSYNDHGYLYLQFGIKDPTKPIIYVRTWQPESVEISKLFNHTDFTIFQTQ